jgi:hypothetical protein
LIPYVLWLNTLDRPARSIATASFVVLAAVSIAIHARAAFSWDVFEWNATPISIDDEPARAWDWKDLQVLRGLR